MGEEHGCGRGQMGGGGGCGEAACTWVVVGLHPETPPSHLQNIYAHRQLGRKGLPERKQRPRPWGSGGALAGGTCLAGELLLSPLHCSWRPDGEDRAVRVEANVSG